MVRLILFDLDGTLIVTGTDYELARNRIKALFKAQGLRDDFYFKPVLPKIREAARQVSSDREKQNNLISQALGFINQVEDQATKGSTLLKGVKETLAFFNQQKVLVGIFSRTSLSAIESEIEKFGLGKFAIIVDRETVPNVKPSPDGIFLAMERLKIKKEEVWVVGDFIYDMQAAASAGVLGLGVLTGVSSREELEDSGAAEVLNSVADLKNLYEKLGPDNRDSRL